MCHKPLRQISTKEIPVTDLRWLQIKFDLPVKAIKEIIKTISIGETITIKTEGTISTKQSTPSVLPSPGSGKLFPVTTITNPKEIGKVITTEVVLHSGYNGNAASYITDKHEDVQPPVVQVQSQNPISEPDVDPVSAPMPNQRTSIPFPSRRNDERRREKANDQIEKFYEIFRDLSFEISFTDALTLMPKFASTLKTLIRNKEKLSEMARTPLNENCSAVILNK
ncbi:hypothetical protein Tco_0894297 [Tanacetum coccineum]|uniref:Reverse transcriptase domain-containing protein n=1 Tax=Tanacetum coccineum TaxID=301880 RepID=A0ABQ5CBE7_9ASTR